MSKFKQLQAALEKKGYSKESSGAIAAKVGMKKLGKKKFEHKAEIGHEKALKKD